MTRGGRGALIPPAALSRGAGGLRDAACQGRLALLRADVRIGNQRGGCQPRARALPMPQRCRADVADNGTSHLRSVVRGAAKTWHRLTGNYSIQTTGLNGLDKDLCLVEVVDEPGCNFRIPLLRAEAVIGVLLTELVELWLKFACGAKFASMSDVK